MDKTVRHTAAWYVVGHSREYGNHCQEAEIGRSEHARKYNVTPETQKGNCNTLNQRLFIDIAVSHSFKLILTTRKAIIIILLLSDKTQIAQ